jgi:hypothetical protein
MLLIFLALFLLPIAARAALFAFVIKRSYTPSRAPAMMACPGP